MTFFLNISKNLLSLISIQTSIHMVLQKGKNREWFVTFWTRKLFLLASWLRCLLGFSSGKQKKRKMLENISYSKIIQKGIHLPLLCWVLSKETRPAKHGLTIAQLCFCIPRPSILPYILKNLKIILLLLLLLVFPNT